MADNYLITGYWGEPHITAENDRGINAAIFGKGRYVLPVGEQFKAEYIGSNTIRIYDGKLINNGAAAGIPAGEYIDLPIANASQGKKRNDFIAFQYEKDASTLVESGKFVVLQGNETSGTASDPILKQQDLLSNEATLDQYALYRVSVSGTAIATPAKVFTIKSLATTKNVEDGIANHNHDSKYAALNHNHDSKYASSTKVASLESVQGTHTEFISSLFEEVSTNTQDKVTAVGTMGGWNYRAWASGTIECWGCVNAVVTSNSINDDLFSMIVCRLDLLSDVKEVSGVTFTSKETALFSAYARPNILPSAHAITIGLKGLTTETSAFTKDSQVSVNVHLFGKYQ